jgi:hypothetical protein
MPCQHIAIVYNTGALSLASSVGRSLAWVPSQVVDQGWVGNSGQVRPDRPPAGWLAAAEKLTCVRRSRLCHCVSSKACSVVTRLSPAGWLDSPARAPPPPPGACPPPFPRTNPPPGAPPPRAEHGNRAASSPSGRRARRSDARQERPPATRRRDGSEHEPALALPARRPSWSWWSSTERWGVRTSCRPRVPTTRAQSPSPRRANAEKVQGRPRSAALM